MKTHDFRHPNAGLLRSLLTRAGIVTLGLGALILNACDEPLDPGSQISSLRVLAVQADNTYAAPGETVHMQALSFDPESRPITWAWALCAHPVSSSVESCIADVATTAVATGMPPLLGMGQGVDNIDVTIPADILDGINPEARPSALVGVLSIACPGTLDLDVDPSTAMDQTNPLPIRCTDSNDVELGLHDTIVGVKRVFIRETDRNANPVIERVTFDGEDWPADVIQEVDGCQTDEFIYDDCKDKGSHQLAAVVTGDSFESGTDEFGRPFAEDVIVQHYTTDGIFQYEVRIGEEPTTGWVARRSASGSDVSIWFVARDDRGGVSYTARTVHVR